MYKQKKNYLHKQTQTLVYVKKHIHTQTKTRLSLRNKQNISLHKETQALLCMTDT